MCVCVFFLNFGSFVCFEVKCDVHSSELYYIYRKKKVYNQSSNKVQLKIVRPSTMIFIIVSGTVAGKSIILVQDLTSSLKIHCWPWVCFAISSGCVHSIYYFQSMIYNKQKGLLIRRVAYECTFFNEPTFINILITKLESNSNK